MPLSKKRDKDRKGLSKFQPNSNPNYTKLSNLKQEKILGLRDMMKDISLDHLDNRLPDDDWADDEVPQDIDILEDNILDIDADGNLIPDF